MNAPSWTAAPGERRGDPEWDRYPEHEPEQETCKRCNGPLGQFATSYQGKALCLECQHAGCRGCYAPTVAATIRGRNYCAKCAEEITATVRLEPSDVVWKGAA